MLKRGPKITPKAAAAAALGVAGALLLRQSGGGGGNMPSRPLIFVDPGHGGKDSGAVNSRDGAKEKDLNLMVATSLERELRAKGYRVALSRWGDTYPSLDSRMERANAAGAALLVSIHFDSATVPPTRNGAYYNTRGEGLARVLVGALGGGWLKHEQQRVDREGRRGLYIRLAHMPAALVELGGTRRITTFERHAYAARLADAIDAYVKGDADA